jgi:periplasmic protein TonB
MMDSVGIPAIFEPPVPPPPPSIEVEDTSYLKGVAKEFDTPPTYKEGNAAFLKFVEEHLDSPHFPRMLWGTVYVSCVVEIDGSLTNVRVKRGIGGGWNELAIRVLQKTSGKWQCGFVNNKPVRSYWVVPVKCEER